MQELGRDRERGKRGAFFKGIINSLNALVNSVFDRPFRAYLYYRLSVGRLSVFDAVSLGECT